MLLLLSIFYVAVMIFNPSVLVLGVHPRSLGIIEISKDTVKGEGLLSSPEGKPKVGIDSCFLGGKVYLVGQSWHPELKPFGKLNCTTCYCKETGKVGCWRHTCPPVTCRNPKKISGECCLVCLDDNTAVDVKVKRKRNRLPRPQTELSVGRNCLRAGETYYDGQMFSQMPNGEVNNLPHCSQCVCVNGKIWCHRKTCAVIEATCQSITRISEDCCPVCADCAYLDKLHANGTTWHPVVESVGEIHCVTCGCMNGEVSCQRDKCLSDSELPCDNPVQDKGTCCKSCPSDGLVKEEKLTGDSVETSEDVTKNNKETEDKHFKKLNNKSAPFGDDEVCLPHGMDVFVYNWQNRTSAMLIFKFRISATVYRWTIARRGRNVTSMNNECITLPQLETILTNNRQLNLIGTTTIRRVEKYRRRVSRWYRKCRDSLCRFRVLRRKERALKLRNALHGVFCKKANDFKK